MYVYKQTLRIFEPLTYLNGNYEGGVALCAPFKGFLCLNLHYSYPKPLLEYQITWRHDTDSAAKRETRHPHAEVSKQVDARKGSGLIHPYRRYGPSTVGCRLKRCARP
jgi:hypothetical protein